MTRQWLPRALIIKAKLPSSLQALLGQPPPISLLSSATTSRLPASPPPPLPRAFTLLFLLFVELANLFFALAISSNRIILPSFLYMLACLLFTIQVSAQMSPTQESISLPLIQSHSHFSSALLCYIILFNCMNRVHTVQHCDERFSFIYFCQGKIILFYLLNVILFLPS